MIASGPYCFEQSLIGAPLPINALYYRPSANAEPNPRFLSNTFVLFSTDNSAQLVKSGPTLKKGNNFIMAEEHRCDPVVTGALGQILTTFHQSQRDKFNI